MSTIRKLTNGNYQVDVTNYEGKRLRLTFSKKSDALALCSTIEKEKIDFKLVHHGVRRAKIKIANSIEEIILEKKSLAPKSYVKYKNVYETFHEFTKSKGLIYINDITSIHAEEFRKILTSSNISPKTINFYLTAAKSLFHSYVLKDVLAKNPFAPVKNEKVRRKTLLEREDDYFNNTEIANFFTQSMDQKYRQAFLGLFLTGMRISELINITWERIDWTNKIIQVRSNAGFTTKTHSSERDIPMSDLLFQTIQLLKKNSSSSYVFTSPSNGKLSERTLLSICKQISEEAGITKNATLHKWRHSFNSHLAQCGVDYSSRQYLMGHKPQSMTDHYTKINPSTLHSEVSKLDLLIPEPTSL
ncbi:MAG: tyrosine-type recombinase/integrase [Melioribacteraceae bacterium]|nr:tyrosine-type recombinase/integrase [Melioribacteraceae bacterium]